jgi:small conductance mechanosensitive channel
MEAESYFDVIGKWLLSSGLQILLVLVLMFLTLKLANYSATRISRVIQKQSDDEYKKRAETLSSILKIALKMAIFAVAALIILGELGVQIGPILAAAGILGLAVGFGAQNLVQDVISGFFLLLEDQVRVGDVVTVAGKGGLVEKVTLRMIILRDLAGNVHYIRNGKIDIVTNMTKEYSRYVFDIGVAYRENVDQVIQVIKEVDEDMRSSPDFKDNILEPIEILGLDRFDESAVVIKARTKTRPIMQWTVGREFNKRLKQRFDQEGIEIPFPHRTIYFGQDKQGQAPAMRVSRPDQASDE